ncbi:unnamed protein product [Ilex paraguariensis]|uniref:Uncharacterized protein n=1 Tax=Ilex paraguariensis TaxID=185542 RepID=A0ABC8TJG7_9AQUA
MGYSTIVAPTLRPNLRNAEISLIQLKLSLIFGATRSQAEAYMALNDIDASVESFKKALVLEPNDGGIKKELAAAKKKASDFSLYDSLIAHVDFFSKLSVYVINSYNHLQIADRRDQEKKAYSRMFQ